MLNCKAVFLIVIVGVVLMQETEAAPKLKLKLLKAKLIGSHVAAKVAVAKEIKLKTAIAAAKTVAAVKAKKAAALAIITAPIKVVKKKLLIKKKKVKALKAAKVAAVAGAAALLAKSKKPIVLPVPVPVPIGKDLDISKSIGGLDLSKGLTAALSVPSASVDVDASSTTPLRSLLAGAQNLISTAGASLPILSTLSNGVSAGITKSIAVNNGFAPVAPAPVYRFVPEVGFSNYRTVSYQPQVEFEAPAPIAPLPVAETHSTAVSQVISGIPHSEYGPPAVDYSLPRF